LTIDQLAQQLELPRYLPYNPLRAMQLNTERSLGSDGSAMLQGMLDLARLCSFARHSPLRTCGPDATTAGALFLVLLEGECNAS